MVLVKQSIAIQKEKVTVLSDTIVLLTAYGEAKIDVSNGSSFSANFYWSFVYEKTDNNWKVIQSHQSCDNLNCKIQCKFTMIYSQKTANNILETNN